MAKADGRESQQVEADGGVYKFAYAFLDPTAPTGPVLQTTETGPLGKQVPVQFVDSVCA